MKIGCNECGATMPESKLSLHLQGNCPGWQREGFMCGIDFASELGMTPATIYPTVKALGEARGCCTGRAKRGACAIVKVHITVQRVVKKGMMI